MDRETWWATECSWESGGVGKARKAAWGLVGLVHKVGKQRERDTVADSF